MKSNFEFVRVNKWRMEFLPKFNMSLQQAPAASGVVTQSITGTLLVNIDQVPLVSTTGAVGQAATWQGDTETGAATSTAFGAACALVDPNYIRGMTGCKEKEIYKKIVQSFYPTFYTPVLDTNINFSLTTGLPYSSTGCFDRQVKKWININLLEAASALPNNGPLYYGPIWALDLNNHVVTSILDLYDVRVHYSVSYRRVKGQT